MFTKNAMSRRLHFPDGFEATPHGQFVEAHFNPYRNNGGSSAAIAGEDFAIIASDIRLVQGSFDILSRNQSKLFNLSSKMVLASTGCWADVISLTKLLDARIQMYKYTHNQDITVSGCSQMLANILYSKRFFPYYANNILAGLDEFGKGVVYDYDPVGCKGVGKTSAGGTATALVQPLLDSLVEKLNQSPNTRDQTPISLEQAERLLHDCFVSAAERETSVGDGVHIKIITRNGIEDRYTTLRED